MDIGGSMPSLTCTSGDGTALLAMSCGARRRSQTSTANKAARPSSALSHRRTGPASAWPLQHQAIFQQCSRGSSLRGYLARHAGGRPELRRTGRRYGLACCRYRFNGHHRSGGCGTAASVDSFAEPKESARHLARRRVEATPGVIAVDCLPNCSEGSPAVLSHARRPFCGVGHRL